MSNEVNKLEIEKRFLVKLPHSWNDFSALISHCIAINRISQWYLSKENKDQEAIRLRKTLTGFYGEEKAQYTKNQKKRVKDGVHKEYESVISKEEFSKLIENADPNKDQLDKTRFVFDYSDQIFELDLFKYPLQLKGLAILEIELRNENETVELPPYLDIKEEITGKKEFSNFSLANK
jgi:CYTH domain-containing protein